MWWRRVVPDRHPAGREHGHRPGLLRPPLRKGKERAVLAAPAKAAAARKANGGVLTARQRKHKAIGGGGGGVSFTSSGLKNPTYTRPLPPSPGSVGLGSVGPGSVGEEVFAEEEPWAAGAEAAGGLRPSPAARTERSSACAHQEMRCTAESDRVSHLFGAAWAGAQKGGTR